MIFEELPFCHFPPLNTSILCGHSQIWLIFHLNILVFQINENNHTLSQSSHVSAIAFAELIFTWKVSHLDSFWDRGTRELGNGLLALPNRPKWTVVHDHKKCSRSLISRGKLTKTNLRGHKQRTFTPNQGETLINRDKVMVVNFKMNSLFSITNSFHCLEKKKHEKSSRLVDLASIYFHPWEIPLIKRHVSLNMYIS